MTPTGSEPLPPIPFNRLRVPWAVLSLGLALISAVSAWGTLGFVALYFGQRLRKGNLPQLERVYALLAMWIGGASGTFWFIVCMVEVGKVLLAPELPPLPRE